jgi:hypothetical protein
MSGAPPTRQNISRGNPPRENGRPGHNPGQPIIKKGTNSEVKSNANRMRRQAVLDRQGHGPGVVLPRAVRGRNHGAGELPSRLESIAPLGQVNPASFSLKSRRGPTSFRSPPMPGKRALMTRAPFPSYLRLVPSAPPPQRLEIRIVAADTRSPIGRTRPFRLTERDLEQLIDVALRMEARAS